MTREEMIIEHDRLVAFVNDTAGGTREALNQIALLECLLLAEEVA